MAWSPGQVIVNSTGAQHQLNRPIPVLARILWDRDGTRLTYRTGRVRVAHLPISREPVRHHLQCLVGLRICFVENQEEPPGFSNAEKAARFKAGGNS
jgi:hypothetical protein